VVKVPASTLYWAGARRRVAIAAPIDSLSCPAHAARCHQISRRCRCKHRMSDQLVAVYRRCQRCRGLSQLPRGASISWACRATPLNCFHLAVRDRRRVAIHLIDSGLVIIPTDAVPAPCRHDGTSFPAHAGQDKAAGTEPLHATDHKKTGGTFARGLPSKTGTAC
jgi:hypothetical protein